MSAAVEVGGGEKRVRAFSGATHAYSRRPKSGTVDAGGGKRDRRDKKMDQGMSRENKGGKLYSLKKHTYKEKASLSVTADFREWGSKRKRQVGKGSVPTYRATRGKRTVSEAEKKASINRTKRSGAKQVSTGVGDYSTAIWFHKGHTDGGYSIACQTARQKDVGALNKTAKAAGEIKYLLVNAKDAVGLLGPGSDPEAADKPSAQPARDVVGP